MDKSPADTKQQHEKGLSIIIIFFFAKNVR